VMEKEGGECFKGENEDKAYERGVYTT
jgi:hypothetical protein